jgi:hypothetical protein
MEATIKVGRWRGSSKFKPNFKEGKDYETCICAAGRFREEDSLDICMRDENGKWFRIDTIRLNFGALGNLCIKFPPKPPEST